MDDPVPAYPLNMLALVELIERAGAARAAGFVVLLGMNRVAGSRAVGPHGFPCSSDFLLPGGAGDPERHHCSSIGVEVLRDPLECSVCRVVVWEQVERRSSQVERPIFTRERSEERRAGIARTSRGGSRRSERKT